MIEPDDPKGYHGFVPLLPGLHTGGNSIKEVKKNLRDAIRCHLDRLSLMPKLPVIKANRKSAGECCAALLMIWA